MQGGSNWQTEGLGKTSAVGYESVSSHELRRTFAPVYKLVLAMGVMLYLDSILVVYRESLFLRPLLTVAFIGRIYYLLIIIRIILSPLNDMCSYSIRPSASERYHYVIQVCWQQFRQAIN